MHGGTHSPREALEHWREVDSLSASYLIRANPLLTYAQKPRTETEEKSVPASAFQPYAASAAVIDAAAPRAAAGAGATRRAVHTKNKTDRKAYNGCCPCGHRDSPVCLCVYLETMKHDFGEGLGDCINIEAERVGD
jgi:hypothetical protein